ncbi:MAG TPA: chemotaxis response regulator protein-glutamate methylesterase [Phycisphaerae bacterium]|nr:chemotaxis response regulator protein-glutamate methylesterase [Phycisphaerae bacterium]HRR85920.1 chemotaxis response regulator protein-glutamate methylesterase [Phycisphaerae bacterium]
MNVNASTDRIRVLVVDDTVTYRKVISDLLAEVPEVELLGSASNGRIAIQKIDQLRPDLLTLDLEMPELNGLDVLRHLRATGSTVGAIMLSAFTTQGAEETIAALSLGAFDFVLKPSTGSIESSIKALRSELVPKIQAFARAAAVKRRLREPAPTRYCPPVLSAPTADVAQRMRKISAMPAGKPEVVAIGISTGGPAALAKMVPALPADLAAPVLIVQHMPPKFTKSLADDLDNRSKLAVSEAVDHQAVEAGRILIAPGGRQMKIERVDGQLVARITDDPPENNCKPSVDYLFRSVAYTCGRYSLGVVMTGMGNDGTLGCRLLKRAGATIITQDETTCVVYGMPKAPAEEGLSDVIAPLDRIASEITRFAGKGALACG